VPLAPDAPCGPSFVQLVKINPAAATNITATRIRLVIFFISGLVLVNNFTIWILVYANKSGNKYTIDRKTGTHPNNEICISIH
jgi:hypothetical protein